MSTVTELHPCTTWCTRQHPVDEIAEAGGHFCSTERSVNDRMVLEVNQSAEHPALVSIWAGRPSGWVEDITLADARELARALLGIADLLAER